MAQTIQLISSSDQSWSGGIAGRHGDNYNFVIECKHLRHELIPDTLWINNESIPLKLKDSINHGNTKITYTENKKNSKVEINVSTQSDRPYQLTRPYTKISPISFKGVALISYRYKGKHHYYEVSGFTIFYPPVNYP